MFLNRLKDTTLWPGYQYDHGKTYRYCCHPAHVAQARFWTNSGKIFNRGNYLSGHPGLLLHDKNEQISARAFLLGRDLEAWSTLVDLDADFVRSVAIKTRYLIVRAT